jgi:hypothetical protein
MDAILVMIPTRMATTSTEMGEVAPTSSFRAVREKEPEIG